MGIWSYDLPFHHLSFCYLLLRGRRTDANPSRGTKSGGAERIIHGTVAIIYKNSVM